MKELSELTTEQILRIIFSKNELKSNIKREILDWFEMEINLYLDFCKNHDTIDSAEYFIHDFQIENRMYVRLIENVDFEAITPELIDFVDNHYDNILTGYYIDDDNNIYKRI